MLRTETKAEPRTLDDLLTPQVAASITRLDLASRKLFAGKLKGERRSKKRGESVEFADHRPYSVGDDLRFIDWNIYARFDALFLKLFLEEEDLSVHIALDCSASMDTGEPSKFLFAQRAAAALAYVGLTNNNRVTLTALGGPAEAKDSEDDVPAQTDPAIRSALRNLRGRRRAHELGSWLCGLKPAGPSDFTEACKRMALTRQGRGVMVVLSDFLLKEGYEDGLRLLAGRGYDLVCLQTLSPQEIEPEIAGDLRLRDLEDHDAAEVTISAPLLKQYKRTLEAYQEELRGFCARRDIKLITAPSSEDVGTLMVDSLRARGVLR